MLEGDIRSFYNSLTNLDPELPIGVSYSKPNRCLVFIQYNYRVDIGVMNYYCKDLVNIKKTALLPSDFKKMMDSLKKLVNSGQLKDDKILVSPIEYGFEIYRTNPMNTIIGPIRLAKVEVISSNNWLFRKIVNYRYKNIIGEEVK